MTDNDAQRLAVEVTRRLRKRGDWVGKGDLPKDAIDRWLNAAAIPEEGLPGYDYRDVADDLESWWRQAQPTFRHAVLNSRPLVEQAAAEAPSWWPAYEQWLDVELRPVVDRLMDPAAHGGVHPGWDDAVDYLKRVAGLRHEEAWAYAADGKPLHVLPLHSESTVHPYGARIVITVMSPLVEPKAVADLYARVAQRLNGESEAPPNIKPDSVRFYLAYDELVRAFPRDKQARLAALPEDLRGTRSPNSAAAYYGKLKKSLLQAFAPGRYYEREGAEDA